MNHTIEALKNEFPTLADFNKQSSSVAKTWEAALKVAQQEHALALEAQALQDSEALTIFDEPEGLRGDLGNFANLFDLRSQGVASKEGFNDAIQAGLNELAQSGNKAFQLLKAVLWVMATEPSWQAEYKQACSYIKLVTPFRVASKVKKSTQPNGKIEKQLFIQLVKVAGTSWRKRPAKFWNKVTDKNEGEVKTITADQLNSRLAKICEQVVDAKIDPSARLVAAATFLNNLGLDALAKQALEMIATQSSSN